MKPASRKYSRVAIVSEFTAIGHDGRESRITASTASRQSLFILLLPSLSVVDKSLITVVDTGINSGSYL